MRKLMLIMIAGLCALGPIDLSADPGGDQDYLEEMQRLKFDLIFLAEEIDGPEVQKRRREIEDSLFPLAQSALNDSEKARKLEALSVVGVLSEFPRALFDDVGALTYDEDAEIRARAYTELARSHDMSALGAHFQRGLEDEDVEVRTAIVRALIARAGQIPGSETMIRQALGDPDREVRLAAVDAHVAIVGDYDADLAGMLADPEPEIRLRVVHGIGELGRSASQAIPTLLELTRSSDPRFRAAALAAGQKVGWPPELATELLLRALAEAPEGRREAITKLSALDEKSMAPLIPELVQLLDVEQPEASAAAATVLGSAGVIAQPAVKPMMEILHQCEGPLGECPSQSFECRYGREPRVCGPKQSCAVIQALTRIIGVAPPEQRQAAAAEEGDTLIDDLVTSLIRRIDAVHWMTQGCAIEALLGFGDEHERAGTALVSNLDSPEAPSQLVASIIRSDPALILSQIEPLAVMINEGRHGGEILAAEILALLGEECAPAQSHIVEALASDRALVRRLAAGILALLEFCDQEQSSALTGLLEDQSPAVRVAAVEALARCSNVSEKGASRLVDLANDDDWQMRAAVLAAAHLMPAERGPGVCTDALGDPNVQVRRRAAACLAESGAPAPKLDALLAAGRDQDPTVRLHVVRALAGVDDERAQALIATLTHDPYPGVRRAALAAGVKDSGL